MSKRAIATNAPHQTPRGRATPIVLLSAMLVALVGGCELFQPNETDVLRQRVNHLEREVGRLEREGVTKDQTIEDLKLQVQRLQKLGTRRLEQLYYPESIELEQLTGGYDEDGRPGDDGVVVYLRPLDRTGDVIKAAGDLKIELFDLAQPDGLEKIGEYIFPVADMEKNWFGRFMTNHYTLRCPWQNGPPAHRDITVRATFVDYLTGRQLSTAREIKVLLPRDNTK